MATLCGWASIDERGKARGGKAGDQKQGSTPDYKGELKLGSWYNFGQTQVFRWKDRTLATKYAKIIKAMCNNKHIGYDQDQRTTLFNWCKNHKWSYKVTSNVECDCSELVGVAINCTVGKQVIPSYIYTGNLSELLMKTGYFTKHTAQKYTKQSTYLMTGDIINAPSHHVISALENGSQVKLTGSTATKKKSTKLAVDGWFGAKTVKATQKFFGTTQDGIVSSQAKADKKYLPRSVDGVWEFKRFGYKGGSNMVKAIQKKVGVTADGLFGKKTAKALQKFLKITQTGKLDEATVKAWQKYLNSKM